MMKKVLLNSLIVVFFITPIFLAFSELGAQEKWWDKFGEPQYGGKLVIPITSVRGTSMDPYDMAGVENFLVYDSMFNPDWTLDRAVWPITAGFVPIEYNTGNLAENWEMTDQLTFTVHIHKGIKWQNKSPVNGREFTAYDIQEHYDRILGTGKYTEPAAIYKWVIGNWERVTATDKYTVVFKFKTPSALNFLAILDVGAINQYEAPEYAALSFDERHDWHNAVGTGPWLLTDFQKGVSWTYDKNPDYWGHDPRFTNNQLPYIDHLKMQFIQDSSTQIAALRTGKVDRVLVDWSQYPNIMRTNPDMQSAGVSTATDDVVFNVANAPFNDIKVRKAMQLSINRENIAKVIYGGLTDGLPSGMFAQTMNGYCYGYDDWAQELKDEYAYNPEKAKELLAEAGYPDGFNTSIVASSASNIPLLEVFKSYFSEIGVNADITTMDNTAYDAFFKANKFTQLAFAQLGSSASPIFAVGYFYSGKKGQNCGEVNDPEYNDLYDQFFSNTDQNEIGTIMSKIDKRVIEQHWAITACGSFQYATWQPYLKGYSGENLGWGQGLILSRLWIDETLKK